MSFLCPECRAALDPRTNTCPAGHRFAMIDDVLVLLSAEFAATLDPFLPTVDDRRAAENKRLLDTTAYNGLPYSRSRQNFEWWLRVLDIAIVHRLVRSRPPGHALDIGAYNGWLCHTLQRAGYRVTGIDYFRDRYDGLAARQFYTHAQWQAVQMDLLDLSLLNRRFDLIVLNRALQFFPDPAGYVEHVKTMLAPGGLLVLTGLDFYRDPQRKAAVIASWQAKHRAAYGRDFFLRPTRGYLDFGDKERLARAGIALRWYDRLFWRNLKAVVLHTPPLHCYGVYRAKR